MREMNCIIWEGFLLSLRLSYSGLKDFRVLEVAVPPCNDKRIKLQKTNLIIYQNYLALSFPHLSSALAGAAMTTLALAQPFIASDAAVAFSFFFATEKGKAPAAMSGKYH